MARESRMKRLNVFQGRIAGFLVWGMIGMAVPNLIAQQPAAQTAAPQEQKSDDSQQPTETIKVGVNVVQLFFNVKDKHGALIPNLTKDDFTIAEDGSPQTVKYFAAESNLPLTLGIMIDSSG